MGQLRHKLAYLHKYLASAMVLISFIQASTQSVIAHVPSALHTEVMYAYRSEVRRVRC